MPRGLYNPTSKCRWKKSVVTSCDHSWTFALFFAALDLLSVLDFLCNIKSEKLSDKFVSKCRIHKVLSNFSKNLTLWNRQKDLAIECPPLHWYTTSLSFELHWSLVTSTVFRSFHGDEPQDVIFSYLINNMKLLILPWRFWVGCDGWNWRVGRREMMVPSRYSGALLYLNFISWKNCLWFVFPVGVFFYIKIF